MDFARRRAELQAALDLNAIKQGELANEAREIQRELRQMELQERIARDKLRSTLNAPTGIQK